MVARISREIKSLFPKHHHYEEPVDVDETESGGVFIITIPTFLFITSGYTYDVFREKNNMAIESKIENNWVHFVVTKLLGFPEDSVISMMECDEDNPTHWQFMIRRQ